MYLFNSLSVTGLLAVCCKYSRQRGKHGLVSLSWGEACRYPATYKNFPHSFCFVQLISFLWSFSFAFARGWPTCIYYGSYTLGSVVSRSMACSNLTDSGEDAKESGRRESEKYAKRGAGREKGREREPPPPFLFPVSSLFIFISVPLQFCPLLWTCPLT